jgi:hypothetical protein
MIAANTRVALVGTTNSGKSYLARYLLKDCQRLIVANPKGLPEVPKEFKLIPWAKGYKLLERGEPARVHLPPQTSAADWEAAFDAIFRLRGVIFYLDELYGVGPPTGSIGLNKLYTQGRALNIGVWASFQRPTRVPLFTLSEASWVFTFRLRLKVDRERMAEICGLDEWPAGIEDHKFLMFHDKEKAPKIAEIKRGKFDILQRL